MPPVGFGVSIADKLSLAVGFRSNFRFRFNCSQMSAARQMLMDRYMTSGFATVGRRDRMQSKKSRTWFNGRCVRAV
jgi:hypothetical protein